MRGRILISMRGNNGIKLGSLAQLRLSHKERKFSQLGFLMPMTFLILVAIGIVLAAMVISKPGKVDLVDPTHPLTMMQIASNNEGQLDWGDSVSFGHSTVGF